MKKHTSLGRLLSLVTALALLVSLCVIPASAAEGTAAEPAASFTNTSGDGGADAISLTAGRSFEAKIPVDMTEAEAQAAAESVVWSLDYDESQPYVDPELYPNHSAGGALDTWLCTDGETPLFSNVTTGAVTENGQVYLTVTFDSGIYFYTTNRSTGESTPDASAPHSNGGAYLDVCGWYDLTATLDGQTLGAVEGVKVAPYDSFHTMEELYENIGAIVDFAAENTGLYVEQFSMGSSQGDNGMESLDMPYLIIAKSEAAVDKWQEIKAEAESDPTALIAKIENGTLGDYQVPVMYSNVHANEVAASDGVLAFAWMLVEAAASESGTIDYDKLTGFTAEGEAELAEQMGPEGQEGSVAVPDLVADTATYLGYLKGENADGTTASVSTVVDLEQYYTIETETVDVDELLDDVFFIIVPEENVEGRTYVTRTSSGGFDLNRDNSFQTQAETQNMTRLTDRGVEPGQLRRVPRPGAAVPVRALRPAPRAQLRVRSAGRAPDGRRRGPGHCRRCQQRRPQQLRDSPAGLPDLHRRDRRRRLLPDPVAGSLGRHVHQLHPPVRHAPRHRVLHRGGARL